MRLSDAYRREGEEKIHLELLVTVHNIVYRDRKKLLMESRALHDYSRFIGEIKANRAAGMLPADAIRAAMHTCMERDIMRAFLKAHEREVVDMVNFEWNQELFEAAKFEEGLEQGLEQGRKETVLALLREKMPLDLIVRVTTLSAEKIRDIGKLNGIL